MTIAILAPGASAGVNDGSGLKYLLTDQLGSVVAVTDNNGAILSQQRYMPFGGTRTITGFTSISQTDFAFTGQRSLDQHQQGGNATIGLLDYHARMMDPLIGRFISPDSVIPSYVNPQTWNKYSYVSNDPINPQFAPCGGTQDNDEEATRVL